MQEFYYYYRDSRNRPIATNCLIVGANGGVAKGRAICSDKDSPCKKTGRMIAKGRAVKALNTRTTHFCARSGFFKYQYEPDLSDFEARIIKPTTIKDRVKKSIAEKLNVPLEEVVPDANIVDDLGADSLDLVELIISMEEEFDIELPDEKAEEMATVQDVLDYAAAIGK